MKGKTLEAIDLTGIMPSDTAVLDILKPGGTDPTGWKITFAGPGHEKTIAWANENARRDLRRQQRIEAAQINGKKYKPDDREPEEVRRENVEWVVSRIVDWTPIKIGADVIAFTPERAVSLFLDRKMAWALGQCIEFLVDERSFSKGSPSA